MEAAPSAPLSVRGVPSSRSISLTWRQPTYPNGVIRQYRITLVHQATTRTLTTTWRSISIESLHPYYTYFIRVAAVTVAEGPFSPELQIKTLQDVPGAAPSIPASSFITSRSFTLTWQPLPEQYHNGILTRYRLRFENRRTRRYSYINHYSSSLRYTYNYLTPYTRYECAVAAATVNGTGPYSTELPVTTLEDAPSGPPLSVRHTALNPTSLVIRWYSPSINNRNGIIRRYNLILNDTTALRTVTSTSYTARNLHPYYVYTYRVAAFTVSLGPYSALRSVRMPQSAPSVPPLNLRVTQRRQTSIAVAWQSPPLPQQNGIITNYTVHITPPEGDSYTLVTVGLSLTVYNLLSNSLYAFAVAASTVAGRGPYTNPSLPVRTSSPDTTAPPQGVNLEVLDHERIFVTWSPPPVSQQSGDITGYTVRITEIQTGIRWTQNSNLALLTLNNLHPFYTYEVEVKALPAIGNGLYSYGVRARTHPAEPSGSPNITYTESTSHSVLLRWVNPPSSQHNGIITGYIINYIANGQAQSLSVPFNVLENSFEASPYTEYVVSIAAVNSVGQGPYSPTVEVRTLEDGPTHHPMNLEGVPLNSTAIFLSWDPPPEEHQNGEIDFYIVLCTEVNSGGLLTVHTVLTTNITLTALHPYYTYNCNVSAFTVEHGPFSDILSTTTLEDAPSSPPRNVMVIGKGPNSVSLSWSAPLPAHQNGIIRHYIISAFPFESLFSNITQRTLSSSTRHTILGMHPYTKYRVSVAAVTINTGTSSDEIHIWTQEDIPSGPPSTPLLVPISPSTLSVTWQPPPPTSRNGIIRHYIIRVLEVELMLQRVVNTSDNATTFSLTDLHPFYEHSVSVAAVTVAEGPFSSPQSVQMPPAAPSGPPTRINIRPLNSTSIHISWDLPSAEHQNGEIDHYNVLCIEVNTRRMLARHTTLAMDITIIELHPYYTYRCNVSAVTVDEGPFSDSVEVTTLEDSPSAPPQNVIIHSIGKRTVTLNWTEPQDEHINGIIRYFIIHVTPTHNWLISSKHNIPYPQLAYTIPDLHPFSRYTINMAAVTTTPGPNSTNIDVKTYEDAPSASPLQLSLNALSSKSLFASWLPPPDETINGILRSYSIKVISSVSGNVTYWNSKTLNLTVTSLHPYHAYQVSVAAITVLTGPYCPYETITTHETEPTGSPTVTIKFVTPEIIHLCWTAPSEEEQNGVITGYLVEYMTNRRNGSEIISVNETEYVLESLPHTIYQIGVAALNSAGQGPLSDFTTITTPQDAPSHEPLSLRSVGLTASSIELQWEPPPFQYQNGIITSYTVLCHEKGFNETIVEISSTTTEASISGLQPFLTYSCRVSAVTVSQGPYSNYIDVTTLEDAPSGRPYNLEEVQTFPDNLSISWTPPDQSQWNGVLRYYIIYVAHTISAYSSTAHSLQTPNNIPNFTITNLLPYTFYQISVAAVTIEPGPNSTSLLLRTGETYPSASPQDISANPISSSSLSITWRAPPQGKQNGVIRYYNVTLLVLPTGDHDWYNTTDSSTHLTLTSLHPYYSYELEVAAVTIGLGPFSDRVRVTMPEAAPSGPPQNMTVESIGSRFAFLVWQPPQNSLQNGLIRHYAVHLMDGNTHITIASTTSSTSKPEINIGFLQPNSTYACSVAAVTISQGPYSQELLFTTDTDDSEAVQSLIALSLSPQTMNISWLPPNDVDEHIIDYQINVTHIKQSNGDQYQTTATSIIVAFLHPNYIYECSVTYRTSKGLGHPSKLYFQLPQDAPSDYPQNITAVPSNSYTLHLYWNPPPEKHQNGEILYYGINITNTKTGQYFIYNTSGPHTSFILYNMHPHTLYMYAITAYTEVGNGPYSPYMRVQMPSAAPSSAPSNISISEIGSTFALLQWLPPPPDELNGVIQHYRIYLKYSTLTHINLTTSGSEQHLLLSSLQPDSNYTFTVAAVTVLPGPNSDPLYFTTNATEPETVQNLEGEALSSQSVNISWDPPQSGEALEYFITLAPLDNSEDILLQNQTYSTSIVVSMLHPATFYYCSVALRTTLGLKQPITILIELPPDAPSGPPLNVLAVALNSRTLYLTWLPPKPDKTNGQIVRYGVNLSNVETGEVRQFYTEDYTPSLSIFNLHPHYSYNYSVSAFTVAGSGPYSSRSYVQMPQDIPDAPPIKLTASNVLPGTVQLQWHPPPQHKRNGDIIGYVIRVFDDESRTYIRELEVDAVKSYIINKLKAFHSYKFSIAAKTALGWGPFSSQLSIKTLHSVLTVPVGLSVERLSATQMRVSWSLQEGFNILFYTIKYYAVNETVRERRDVVNNIKFINTTKNITIHNLHPTFSYSVSVAANTISGRGNFSDEIKVGLSEYGHFQLFLSGEIHCQEWVKYHINTKLASTKVAVSQELEKICECLFSEDYMSLYQPHCLSAHTDWLIIWGKIVGTNLTKSATLINQLQEWSKMESKVVLEGVHLTTLKFCPVILNEGEPPYCETITESKQSGENQRDYITYIIVGVIMLMLAMIFAVLICLVTVSLYKKKKLRDRQLRFHAAHPLDTLAPTSDSIAKPGPNTREDNDSLVYDQVDGIYETILGEDSPYSQLPLQPPPLPESSIPTKLPLDSAEPQDSVPMIYDTEAANVPQSGKPHHSPSPEDYTAMKLDSASPKPDNELDYATVEYKGAASNKMNLTDDYVPVGNEAGEDDEKEEMMYDNCESAKELYEVVWPQSMNNNSD